MKGAPNARAERKDWASAEPSAPAVASASAAPAPSAPSAAAPTVPVASARPAGPLPERPDYPSRANAQRTIQEAIARCEGHYGRHVRLNVHYEGATGRPTEVIIAGSFWADKPVTPCIEAAARSVSVSPFSRPVHEQDYTFEVH